MITSADPPFGSEPRAVPEDGRTTAQRPLDGVRVVEVGSYVSGPLAGLMLAELGAAVVNLIRPTLPVFALGLAAAAFGVVLYNVGLSALAAAILILSFARPVAIESEQD